VIDRIYHVNVNCSDLDASREFYKQFGFSVIVEFDEVDAETIRGLGLAETAKARGVLLGQGTDPALGRETRIDLLEWSDTQVPSAPGPSATQLGVPRLALYTKSLDDEVHRLQDEGLEPVAEIADFSGTGDSTLRSRFVCFRDPDGLLVELIEFTRTAA